MKINLKHTLMLALFVGSSAAAIFPATAVAKKGDLYLNKDGGCDPGDVKKGYWCVESIAARDTSKAGAGTDRGTGAAPSGRTYPKPGPLVNRPTQPKP